MINILQNSYISNLIDFIFPQLCLGCGQYCENNKSICNTCERQIEQIKLPYCLNCMAYIDNDIVCTFCSDKTIPLYSYADYASPMREIVIQYKFRGITTPANIFAKRLFSLYNNLIDKYKADYLIPIPLYKSRENIRGYNQATILANDLSELFQIPVNDSIIYRIKKRKPQARLEISERKNNIQNVFHVEQTASEKKKCILVDDVVTTGNTVFEATKELEKSGYKVVAVISIAHAF